MIDAGACRAWGELTARLRPFVARRVAPAALTRSPLPARLAGTWEADPGPEVRALLREPLTAEGERAVRVERDVGRGRCPLPNEVTPTADGGLRR